MASRFGSRIARRKKDPVDTLIERVFYATCSGVQIDILDIPKVFAAGRAAHARGEDLVAAITSFVASIRKN